MKKTMAAMVVAASLALGTSHAASAGTTGDAVATSSAVPTVVLAQTDGGNSKDMNETAAGTGENRPGSSFVTVWNVLLGVFTLGSLGAIITTIMEKAGVLNFLKR